MWRFLACCVLVLVCLQHSFALAAPTKPPAGERSAKATNAGGEQRPTRAKKAAKTAAYTPEREAAALAFVGQQHPELTPLLSQLKANKPKEYEAAIRDLFRTSERLAGIQERNPERYALEIENWKLRSQLQLVAARATMPEPPGQDAARRAHEAELRRLLDQQVDGRVKLLQFDREQLLERADELQSQITALQSDRADEVERRFERLMSKVEKSRRSRRDAGKPRANQAAPKLTEKGKPGDAVTN